MKTSLLVLASLALGTAAIAQDATPQTMPAPAATDSMPAPAANTATPTPDQAAAPGANTAAPTPDATAAASTDTSNYPVCSRTVTDKCVQRGAMRHHKA